MDEPAPRPIRQNGIDLKWNTHASRGHCALCDAVIYPPVGLGLFLARTGEGICDECGQERAPGLLAIRDTGRLPSVN